jgi:hypothetical protein
MIYMEWMHVVSPLWTRNSDVDRKHRNLYYLKILNLYWSCNTWEVEFRNPLLWERITAKRCELLLSY